MRSPIVPRHIATRHQSECQIDAVDMDLRGWRLAPMVAATELFLDEARKHQGKLSAPTPVDDNGWHGCLLRAGEQQNDGIDAHRHEGFSNHGGSNERPGN